MSIAVSPLFETLEVRRLLAVSPASDPAHPAATMLPGVPAYHWNYGCAPTSFGMILGYWDGNGFPNIFSGDATSQTQAVTDAMAGPAHRTAGAENRPVVVGGRYWGWGDWQSSASVPNHETSPSSIADWIRTVDGTAYGRQFSSGISGYLIDKGYGGWSIRKRDFTDSTWDEVVQSVQQRRPVMAIVDINGDEYAEHAVPIVGFDPANNQYAVLDTMNETPQWHEFGPKRQGGVYGIESLWSLTPPAARAPRIEVVGNHWVIARKDTTPEVYDGTDFGASGTTRTFRIYNGGDKWLDLPRTGGVTITGANRASFKIVKQPATHLAPGADTLLKVQFGTRSTSLRSATLMIRSNDPTKSGYSFAIQGKNPTAAPAVAPRAAVWPQAAGVPETPAQATGLFSVTPVSRSMAADERPVWDD